MYILSKIINSQEAVGNKQPILLREKTTLVSLLL